MPRNSSRSRFNDDYDQFEDSGRFSRRFKPQDDDLEDDYMERRSKRRNLSRAIPESAVSRRRTSLRDSSQYDNNKSKRRRRPEEMMSNDERGSNFGERRALRNEVKRGSRPLPNKSVSEESTNSPSKFSPNKTTRPSIRTQTSGEK